VAARAVSGDLVGCRDDGDAIGRGQDLLHEQARRNERELTSGHGTLARTGTVPSDAVQPTRVRCPAREARESLCFAQGGHSSFAPTHTKWIRCLMANQNGGGVSAGRPGSWSRAHRKPPHRRASAPVLTGSARASSQPGAGLGDPGPSSARKPRSSAKSRLWVSRCNRAKSPGRGTSCLGGVILRGVTPQSPGSSQTVRKTACSRHLRADLSHMPAITGQHLEEGYWLIQLVRCLGRIRFRMA
jgi:hypothetical protein